MKCYLILGAIIAVLSKLSKSDQNDKSIIEISQEVIKSAKLREEEYEKIRVILREKYGIKEST